VGVAIYTNKKTTAMPKPLFFGYFSDCNKKCFFVLKVSNTCKHYVYYIFIKSALFGKLCLIGLISSSFSKLLINSFYPASIKITLFLSN